MVMTAAGYKRGWAVEHMPEPRIMGDAILTPDGKVLLINGAGTGIAGYGQWQSGRPGRRKLLS